MIQYTKLTESSTTPKGLNCCSPRLIVDLPEKLSGFMLLMFNPVMGKLLRPPMLALLVSIDHCCIRCIEPTEEFVGVGRESILLFGWDADDCDVVEPDPAVWNCWRDDAVAGSYLEGMQTVSID